MSLHGQIYNNRGRRHLHAEKGERTERTCVACSPPLSKTPSGGSSLAHTIHYEIKPVYWGDVGRPLRCASQA
jgi:hypothetical protein